MRKYLSREQIRWCQIQVRKLKREYERYLSACERLHGTSYFQIIRSNSHKNATEEAYVVKADWEKKWEKLSEELREFLLDVVEHEYPAYTREDYEKLRKIVEVFRP